MGAVLAGGEAVAVAEGDAGFGGRWGMKIRITYQYSAAALPFPCIAQADIGGRLIPSCAETFEEARERLIKTLLQSAQVQEVPADEEVEL